MFGLTRWNSFDDVFTFQREVDRLFNQFWNDLPTRTAAAPSPSFPMNSSPSFQVNPTDEGWRVDVPLPGIDPRDVNLEVAGNNLTIRAEVIGHDKDQNAARYEQTLTIPQFLDLDKLSASHRHGMLRLTLPLKESVKPRRVQIDTQAEDHKQLVGAR
jgi:HSP20 family protein